ncbi:hypothetical protein BH23PLA1_BH23PLA1_30760 [soil metagenome]
MPARNRVGRVHVSKTIGPEPIEEAARYRIGLPMSTLRSRPSFTAPELREALRELRRVDNRTNLLYLIGDYLTGAMIVAGAVAFAEWRLALGLVWAWNVPVFVLAIVLLGGVLHRLAGLGHEAAHYSLLRNKFWNDLIADLFCFFPLCSSVHLYRVFHLAHHQYVNDPERDPDLVNLGRSKGVEHFPMTRGRFVRDYYLRLLLSPGQYLRYTWDYVYVNVFGKGGNIYMRRVSESDGHKVGLRLATWLGLAYLFGLGITLWALMDAGASARIWLVSASAWLGALGVLAVLPNRTIFQPPFRQPYSTRFSAAFRLGWWTLMLASLAQLGVITDVWSIVYVFLLFVIPMSTSFFFYMLLRDIYQHTNADQDRITNTRVFYADPFTRWAVFVHGQGYHTPHHLFPAIPHYRLDELHRVLKQWNPEYAERVVECQGTFANRSGLPTILDVLTIPAERSELRISDCELRISENK